MPRRGQLVMQLRFHEGRVEKLCTKCRWWKDVQRDFYKRPDRRVDAQPGAKMPRPECKDCSNQEAGRRHAPHIQQHGLVPWSSIERYVNEAIDRIGAAEFCRRAGVTQQQLWKYRHSPPRRCTRTNAAKMLDTARGVLRSGEVRTREEIHHGDRSRVHEPSDGDTVPVPEEGGAW